jgi:ABC-type Fe3+/spermidine/putrescine transport system ATPase subunit
LSHAAASCAQGYALRPVHTLSGGQKQRVAIAGALAERPQVQRRALFLLSSAPLTAASACAGAAVG